MVSIENRGPADSTNGWCETHALSDPGLADEANALAEYNLGTEMNIRETILDRFIVYCARKILSSAKCIDSV